MNKAVALILLTGLLAYSNTFTKTFILDDGPWITNNSEIGDLFLYIQGMPNRWVVMVANQVNFRLSNYNPLGYHALNLGVHLAAALVLFGLVRRTLLLGRWGDYYTSAATPLATAVALLWVAHPLQTHAVTYIIQRCESMMGLFYLLTVYCVLRGATAPRGGLWYVSAFVAAFLGAGCKEIMASAPLTVLAYDWVFLAGSLRELLRKRWWVYLGIAAAVWGFIGGMQGGAVLSGEDGSVGFGMAYLPWHHYLMTEGWVILHYLRLAVWPIGLCFDYRDWPVTRDFLEFLPAGLAVGSLFLVSLYGTLRRRWWGFVGLWFFLVLSVSSSVLPIADPANEYRMYLPVASVIVFAVIGGDRLLRHLLTGPHGERLRPFVAGGLLGSAVAALTVLTLLRNEDYTSTYTMWMDVLAKRPNNAKVYNDAGIAAEGEGRPDEARRLLEEGVRRLPTMSLIHNNLAMLLWREGETEAAIKSLKEALKHQPDMALAHFNFGRLELARGNWAAAEKSLRRAVELSPRRAIYRGFLGAVLAERGDLKGAAAEYAEALRLDDDWPESARKQAWTALVSEKGIQAERHREALALARQANDARQGKDPEALDVLAAALAANGRYQEAAATARSAIARAAALERQDLVPPLQRRLQLYESGRPVTRVSPAKGK